MSIATINGKWCQLTPQVNIGLKTLVQPGHNKKTGTRVNRCRAYSAPIKERHFYLPSNCGSMFRVFRSSQRHKVSPQLPEVPVELHGLVVSLAADAVIFLGARKRACAPFNMHSYRVYAAADWDSGQSAWRRQLCFWEKVFRPFVEKRPVCVMARGILERLLDPQRIDVLFDETAELGCLRGNCIFPHWWKPDGRCGSRIVPSVHAVSSVGRKRRDMISLTGR